MFGVQIKAHKGDIDNVIKQVSEKLSETANSLQQAVGPDAQAKAKELKEKFDVGIKNAYEEIEKLVKAVEPDVQSELFPLVYVILNWSQCHFIYLFFRRCATECQQCCEIGP